MAKMQIDVSNVRDAADKASKAANELEKYADRIDKKVANPLGTLTGGSSGYTNSAQTLATTKARSVRARARQYHKLSVDLKRFATDAEAADKDVYTKFHTMYKARYSQLSVWQKMGATVYRLFNNAVGSTKIGKVMMTGVNLLKAGAARVHSALQSAVRWFQYGNGKYVLEIVIGVAAAVAAIVALFNPVTGPLAVVALVAGIIAATYATGKAIMTLIDSSSAIATSKTDPGLARYKGGTSSFLDFAKKHFNNKTIQKVAGVGDVIGITASIVKSGLDFFKSPKLDKAAPQEYKFSWENLKYNVKSSFGFEAVKNDDASAFVRNDKGQLTYKWEGVKKFVEKGFGWKETSGKSTIGDATAISKDVSVVTKEFQSLTHFVNGETEWSDAGKYALKHIPGVRDGYSPIKDGIDIGKTIKGMPSSSVNTSSMATSVGNATSLGASLLNEVTPNGGNVFAQSTGHVARNLTSSGFTTGITCPSVDRNVFSKVSSGLISASRVTTLPDVGYTYQGNISTGLSIPKQFGTAGNLLPSTSVTMDRALFRAAIGVVGAAGVAKKVAA